MSVDLASQADQFVQQLCNSIVAQLSSAAGASVASTPGALKLHLQGTFRALAPTGSVGQLREYLLGKESLERYAAKVEKAIEQAKRKAAAAAVGPTAEAHTALFSSSDYLAALAAIDTQVEADPSADLTASYTRLLLPPSAPSVVYEHLVRTLSLRVRAPAHHAYGKHKSTPSVLTSSLPLLLLPFRANGASASTLLDHLTALAGLCQSIPAAELAHSAAAVSAIVTRTSTAFAALPLTLSQTRLFQDRLSRLLLVEARTYSSEDWTAEQAMQRFVLRVRQILRRIGGSEFSGSLSGEMLFLQHALAAYAEEKPSKSSEQTAKAAVKTEKPSAHKPDSTASSAGLPVFQSATFLSLFSSVLGGVLLSLSSGGRTSSEGEESIWLRVAVVGKTAMEAGGFGVAKQTVQSLLAKLPRLPLPLLLRPTMQDRYPSIRHVQDLWTAGGGVKLGALERMIEEVEGVELKVRDVFAQQEEAVEMETDEPAAPAAATKDIKPAASVKLEQPASKRRKGKKAQTDAEASGDSFSAFGSAHTSLFFVDSTGTSSGAASSAPAAGAGAGADAEEEREVGRSMTKILAGMTPVPATNPPAVATTSHGDSAEEAKPKGGKTKATKRKAEEEQAAPTIEEPESKKEEEDPEAGAKAADDADESESQKPAAKAKGKSKASKRKAAEEPSAPEEESADAAVPMEDDAPAAAAEEEAVAPEEPAQKKGGKRGASKKAMKAKEEAEAPAAAEEPKPTRSKRAKK